MTAKLRLVPFHPSMLVVGAVGLCGLLLSGILAMRSVTTSNGSNDLNCGALLWPKNYGGSSNSIFCSSALSDRAIVVILVFVVSLLILALTLAALGSKVRVKIPVAVGERVIIRGPKRRDADAIEATVDGDVASVMGWPEGMARLFANQVRGGDPVSFLIIDERSTGKVAGIIQTLPDLSIANGVRLGFWMGPDHRRTGLMTEALGIVVGNFTTGGRPCRAETSVDNLATQRVLERVGLTVEGQRRIRLPDGSSIDGLIYSCFPDDPAGVIDGEPERSGENVGWAPPAV